MKSKFYVIISLVILIFLSACKEEGNYISEVKLIPVKNGTKYQYIDKNGKIIINPQFSEASIFRDGIALVQTSSDDPKWGFISEDGKYAINAQYKDATVFSEGLAWVVAENAKPVAIDKKGEQKFILENAEKVRSYKDGLAAFSIINEDGDELWGFIDKEGKVKINPQFDFVNNFSEGVCGVRNSDGKWGLINKEGIITVNYQFDGIFEFIDGLCVIVLVSDAEIEMGVINKSGKYVINPQFSYITIDNDLYLFSQDGKVGWCDSKDNYVINPQFDWAYPFYGNNITPVKSGESWGFIDRDGKYIINPQFDNAWPFNGNIALVEMSGKFGFIDKSGKYVINPQYDAPSIDFLINLMRNASAMVDDYDYLRGVKSDYFDVQSIVDIVDINRPEGFSINSTTFEDIIRKYKLETSVFNEFSEHHVILDNVKITNEASFSFAVGGKSHDQVTVERGYGYYSYLDTEYIFNKKNKIVMFFYIFELYGKGLGKDEILMSAIEQKISDKGFKKNSGKYEKQNVNYWTNGKVQIAIGMEGTNLNILFWEVR